MQMQAPDEIYYETSVHKKFLADVYAVIPKGRKCVLWFKNNQCRMFQIAKRPYTPNNPTPGTVQYDDERIINMPFTNDAWFTGQGTMVYGTCIFEKRNDVQKRFSVENVIWLCGKKQPDNGSLDRFSAFFDAYSQEPSSRDKHHFQLHMPIMHATFNDAVRDAIKITTYEVFCIQHRFLNRRSVEFKNLAMTHIDSSCVNEPPPRLFFPKQANARIHDAHAAPQPTVMQPAPALAPAPAPAPAPAQPNASRPQTRTFMICPDAQNDIYYVLRSSDEPITENTMIAHIPNYKTSVMMNAIFRNIKENRNLDALEESDDEDAADTTTPLVDLNKRVRMTCTFSPRFKRWQPVESLPFQS